MTRGPQSTEQMFRTVLGRNPEVLAALTDAHEVAWSVVDADLLDLCRVHIAALLGHDAGLEAPCLDAELLAELPGWFTSPRFSAAQRACLAFTEQFTIDAASIDDDLVAAVAAELGPDGLVNFVNALLVVEQRQRLHLIWSRLLAQVAS